MAQKKSTVTEANNQLSHALVYGEAIFVLGKDGKKRALSPDEIKGARVRAVVSLRDGQVATERELQEFCREHLANYKVPKQVIFLDSLPRTATGKLDKKSIRDCLSIPPLFQETKIS